MSDDPISNPTVRSAVDRVFAHHSLGGFLLLVASVSIVVVMVLALLMPAGDGGGEAVTPLLNQILAALVVLGAVVGVGWLWIVRRYYRRIYGSEYHRR
ncbi:MAG: hypothetical protein MUC44_05295 [Beijerinckiaceae bacterium]|jgi:uncharacterized membrane protein YozB (DUF420 family)|nr:hypothetical protein [Beijerinckiaceae bacterium]